MGLEAYWNSLIKLGLCTTFKSEYWSFCAFTTWNKIYNFDNREAVAALNQESHEIQLKSKEVEELRQEIRSNYAEIDHFRRQIEEKNQDMASCIRAVNDEMKQLEMLADK